MKLTIVGKADINFIKNLDVIYAIDRFDRVRSFKSVDLFDINGTRFSDGYGNSWNYCDIYKTWGDNKEQLYELKYDEFRIKSHILDELEYIIKGSKTTDEQKVLLINAYLYGFYGRLYGVKDKSYNVYFIPGYKASMGLYVSDDGTKLMEIIGMPGPDYAYYKIEEYSESWSLRKEDLE